MNKVFGASLLALLLVGCGKQIPNDGELVSSINDYQLQNSELKAKELRDMECQFEYYAFPDEKKMPSYSCKGKLELSNGKVFPVTLLGQRRMNGELVIDSMF